MSSSKKKKQPNLSTYCAVLPTTATTLSEDVFSVTETSVSCPDTKFENVYTYPFQHVFNGLKDLHSAFERHYSPLIKHTAAGESTMLAFCGLPVSDSIEYFTSVSGRVGIINLAAQALLRTASVDAKNPGTVTLSWYKIDCGDSEAITDLLRTSSSLHSHRGPDPNLVLRELGKGRGMIVPGLWEVELTTPQDADAVINHVHRMLPQSTHDGHAHSVFQLTVSPHDYQQKSSYHQIGSRATIADDSPGVGRLTIVLLSDLGPVRNPSYTDPSPFSGAATPSADRYPWVGLTADILRWIESKRPSPPFHRSRILLLLRDSLCSRMHCALTLFLSPAVRALPDNTAWLELVTRIHQTSDDRQMAVGAIAAAAAAMRTNVLTPSQTSALAAAAAAANVASPGAFSDLDRFQQDRKGGRGASLEKTSAIKNSSNRAEECTDDMLHLHSAFSHHSDTMNVHDLAPSDEDRVIDAGARSPPVPPQPSRQKETVSSSTLPPNSSDQRHGRVRGGAEEFKGDGDSIFPLQQECEQYHPQDHRHGQQSQSEQYHPQDHRHGQPSQAEQYHPQDHRHGQPSQLEQYHPQDHRHGQQSQSEQYHPQDHRHGQPSQPEQYHPQDHRHGQQSQSEQYHPQNHRHMKTSGLPEGALDAEGARALIASLEASRSEVASLRRALAIAQQSVAQYKAECERVSKISREEGETLKARDRARLKQALQDLKDYEVMEAAMTRMQSEMDKIEKENHAVKDVQRHLEKELRKSKSIQNKVLQDADSNQKSRKDLARRLEAAEEQLRTVMQEREAAVQALTQFKSEKSREIGDMQTGMHKKDVEMKNLRKKLSEAESRFKALSSDNTAAATLHEQEIQKLRTAHAKSLEMLMAYQEENDLLRSAMSDMLEKDKESAAPPSASHDKPSSEFSRSPSSTSSSSSTGSSSKGDNSNT